MTRTSKPTDVFLLIDMSGGKDACWPFKGKTNSEGRPYVQIKGKKYLAYRLVWELVNGEELGTRMFRHKCDNPICCNPSHGIAGTHEENMHDMKTRERHGLPHHAVKAIRKLIGVGVPDSDIAERFGVARTTIYDIRVGNTYGHVVSEEV